MSYPIPSYHLIIEKEDLKELKRDIWSDDTVPAYLKVNNVTYDIDIAFRGAYTRDFLKKSYSIEFINPDRYDGARKIHLNAEYNDPSLIRNKLSFDFFHDLGVLSPHSQHIHLKRNDSNKGVYLQLESVDDLFMKKRNLPLGSIYYAVNYNANFSMMTEGQPKRSMLSGYRQVVGKEADDHDLYKLIRMINRTPLSEIPDKISQYIDIEKYLRWLVGVVCTMNNDGFTHNYALYRNSETGLFEIIPWDYDATWGRRVSGDILKYNYVPIKGNKDNHLSQLLLQIPEFRKSYRQMLEETLETKFTVEYQKNRVLSMHEALRPFVLLDPYKKNNMKIFEGEPEFIFHFIRKRNRFLKRKLSGLD